MTLKIPTTLDYEGEKIHIHSYRLLLFLMKKKITALGDLIINFFEVMHLTGDGEIAVHCFTEYQVLFLYVLR